MTNPDSGLRPIQKIARTGSMSLAESADAIAALTGGAYQQEMFETPLREAPQNLSADDQPEVGAEDILFGPMALTYSVEDRHRAAWAIWEELLRTQDALERSSNEIVVTPLRVLHSDNGFGYCQGCGQGPDGAYVRKLIDCPTLALLQITDPGESE